MEKTLALNLKKAKLKVTPQRLTIYSYLVNSKDHPNVERIYNDLKPSNPSMSLATVYKNVAALRDAHLITEFNVGENNNRYDANIDFHTHLVCSSCHNIYDYYVNIPLDNIINDLKNNTDFQVKEQRLVFYGLCNHCVKKDQ